MERKGKGEQVIERQATRGGSATEGPCGERVEIDVKRQR